MSKADPDAKAQSASPADRKAVREARLAQALRDNLRRRKAPAPPAAGEASD